jgi:hypothetical protein
MITIKLIESDKTIQKMIHREIATLINKKVEKKSAKAIAKIKRSILFWIGGSPEMRSLAGASSPGSLKSQFGLTDAEASSALDAISTSIANSITIKVGKIDARLTGKITINIQPLDLSNLLILPQGHRMTKKGTDLHWLDWLLTKGDSVVIVGYKYSTEGSGRSGVGKMTKGGSFRVSPQYSGTKTNNFITRSLEARQSDIVKILGDILNG